MEQQKSQKAMRRRRFLMALPILALPFITMLFWALGGGTMEDADAQETTKKGFNLELPDAHLKDDNGMDKMSYYEQASTDSLKLQEQMKNDPYFRSPEAAVSDDSIGTEDTGLLYSTDTYRDANETKVYDRIKKLDEALKAAPIEEQRSYSTGRPTAPQVASGDLDRLEQMMQVMQQGNGDDPEMEQLDGMMERILDMQHPERVQEKLRKASEERKGQAFAVYNAKRPDPVSLLSSDQQPGIIAPLDGGFFSFDHSTASSNRQNIIEAAIHETQTVVSGATIKLRLLNDLFINGHLVPRDQFVYGSANLSGERLRIQITGIHYGNNLFPVAINVYDMDGIEGINVPGAITRDVAKQSADRSLQNIGLTSIDPSWQVQAAGAGVEAAKSLFSKKVKLVKVTLKAGYRVLLYDEKQKQSDK